MQSCTTVHPFSYTYQHFPVIHGFVPLIRSNEKHRRIKAAVLPGRVRTICVFWPRSCPHRHAKEYLNSEDAYPQLPSPQFPRNLFNGKSWLSKEQSSGEHVLIYTFPFRKSEFSYSGRCFSILSSSAVIWHVHARKNAAYRIQAEFGGIPQNPNQQQQRRLDALPQHPREAYLSSCCILTRSWHPIRTCTRHSTTYAMKREELAIHRNLRLSTLRCPAVLIRPNMLMPTEKDPRMLQSGVTARMQRNLSVAIDTSQNPKTLWKSHVFALHLFPGHLMCRCNAHTLLLQHLQVLDPFLSQRGMKKIVYRVSSTLLPRSINICSIFIFTYIWRYTQPHTYIYTHVHAPQALARVKTYMENSDAQHALLLQNMEEQVRIYACVCDPCFAGMYVCMYVSMHVCMYACMCVCVCVCVCVCMSCIHVCIYACMHVCYVCMYACMYVWVYGMCVCVCVSMCVCMYVYACMHACMHAWRISMHVCTRHMWAQTQSK